jgi:RNA polymerase sigma-70 factor, ECF subfamily
MRCAARWRMPEKKRIDVLLADCHELTYREIVDTLKIPIGTIRSRVARGRQLMRALIEGQCPCSRKAKTPSAQ